MRFKEGLCPLPRTPWISLIWKKFKAKAVWKKIAIKTGQGWKNANERWAEANEPTRVGRERQWKRWSLFFGRSYWFFLSRRVINMLVSPVLKRCKSAMRQRAYTRLQKLFLCRGRYFEATLLEHPLLAKMIPCNWVHIIWFLSFFYTGWGREARKHGRLNW